LVTLGLCLNLELRCFMLIFLVATLLVANAEVTGGRGLQDYNVNAEAIYNGPARNMSTQDLCDGAESGFEPLRVYADRDTISQGGRAIETCEMNLNPYFAQLIKAFIPRCAKEAAVSVGMNLPTRVSLEQMGGYANRNARNSDQLSRHALGMALDISAISLETGNSTQRIRLTENSNNQPFYDAFRSCWDKAVEKVNGKNCTCSIGHAHTHPPSNTLHNDHMHISLACPPGGAISC
jgi:hypothetical protein